MSKVKVAVMQCGTYNTDEVTEKINEGVKQLGGWERFLKPGMNVLLKVNLIGPVTSETAAVTHCEFVRAITRIVKQYGCNVWIGDSAGGAIGGKAQTPKALSVSGLAGVAEEEGAVIKNFDIEGVVEVEAPDAKMYLAKPVFDADLVINLPKLKTHMSASYTGAVKNLFGCVPGQKKAEYHKAAPSAEKLGRIICDINKAVKIGLNIMDGVIAMDRQGPVAGHIYEAKKILISEDRLALDAVAADMIGKNIEDLPILKASIEEEIGEWRLGNIEVCGDFDSPPRLVGFKVPKAVKGGGGGALKVIIDLLKTRPQMDLSKCKKCNVCVDSCPVGAIDRETKKIDYAKCIECMCCHELCVHKAVKLVRSSRVMRLFSR
jgi:uncharacterized protein (DUF362 family)/Pyruvate/2-oxoacid:ferredoxin oxidoreductase delta subunit